MLLVRIIILKCILTICSASARDVINLKFSKSEHNGMSINPTVWLTENKTFSIHIQSDEEIKNFWCSNYHELKLIKLIKQANFNYKYLSTDKMTTDIKMKCPWTCKAMYSDGNIQECNFKVNIDQDECQAGIWPCSTNANCTNTLGSFECTCLPGYRGNGTYCQVVDLCLSNPCPDHEECHNEGTSYRCSAANPCQSDPCHEKAICIDQKLGFRCECRTGFTGDGYSCSAVDPCQSNPCHEKATCVEHQPGVHRCECIKSYEGDGHKCKGVDECHYNPCHPQADCVNTYPGYTCNCRPGFTGDGHSSCSDVNECLYNLCHASLICINTIGGFGCWCEVGYIWNTFYNSCTDIDECRTHRCHNYSSCKNTAGSFYCECQQGYRKNTKERCEDINECQLNISNCKKEERCWNIDGSFKCCQYNEFLDKNGYCTCPYNHIYHNNLCVYNQCSNTSCGLGAKCMMIDARAQCYCPNGYTGNPLDGCAVLAEPGPSPNREARESNSLEPSIDISIYVDKTDKSLKHLTTVDELILDKSFTISVSTKELNFTKPEKRLTCNEKGKNKNIHLNKMLKLGKGSNYIATVPKAYKSMIGNWRCLVKGSTTLAFISVEFPVTVNEAAFIEVPVEKAFVPADGMIYLEFDNDKATAKNTTLLLKKPFAFVIKSTSEKVHNITNIICYSIGGKNEMFTQNENLIWNEQERVYKAQEGEAIMNMKKKWTCIITYYKKEKSEESEEKSYHNHISNTSFEVTVKNPEFVKHVYVFVNDVIVNTTLVEDAHGTYEVSVGEIVKVSCRKDDAHVMDMGYFDGNSYNIVTKTSSNNYQTMYLKIGEFNTHVRCNVKVDAFNNHDEQSIKLDFIKKRRLNDLPTFNVNGLALAPVLAASGDHYTLFYEYFEGEFINCTVTNVKRWEQVDKLEEAELNGRKLIYSDYAQNKTITFKSKHDSKTISFNLRPVPNNFDATISGLPFSQINIKYLYNSLTYRTVFFNKNNKILNLTCSSSVYTNCSWYQNKSMTNGTTDTSIKNITFLPQSPTSPSTILKCICVTNIHSGGSQTHEKVHEVTILRDNARKPSSEGTQETNASKENSLGEPSQSGSSNGNNRGGESTLILVVVIVVALIVVAAVAWLMVGLYKRRQRRAKATQFEFNYESLENTTERTMPPPAQRDNYSLPVDREKQNDTDTYSVPYVERNVEDMYTKPQPKALRKPPNESLYAEPSHATIEQLGEKPTYGNLSNQTAEYSQIQPKKLIGNPNAPKVLPTASPYAEVLPKCMRPNKESSKYANVFDTQRYVNSDNGESSRDRSEYAEPAYCEVGFMK